MLRYFPLAVETRLHGGLVVNMIEKAIAVNEKGEYMLLMR
jgi:hypothetical protein